MQVYAQLRPKQEQKKKHQKFQNLFNIPLIVVQSELLKYEVYLLHHGWYKCSVLMGDIAQWRL